MLPFREPGFIEVVIESVSFFVSRGVAFDSRAEADVSRGEAFDSRGLPSPKNGIQSVSSQQFSLAVWVCGLAGFDFVRVRRG